MKEQWKVKEILTLGRYPQSRADACEPIEWRVLKVDGERALVTSLFALDAQPFHTGGEVSAGKDKEPGAAAPGKAAELLPPGFQEAAWETSTLRAWLNRGFLAAAFSGQERECLLETDELKDKVTLLALDANINNAEQFPTDASTGCRATPYAAGLYEDNIEEDRQQRAVKPLPPRASYWLKDKGMVIHGDGMEGVLGVVSVRFDLVNRLAVRPVLLLDLNRYESLLDDAAQTDSFFGRMFKRKTQIVHRFDEEKENGTLRFDYQNRRLLADGIGFPDLHVELPIQGRMDKVSEQALGKCLTMAIHGDPKAQNSIGSLLWNGQLFVQDYREAVRWNRYAAKQGLPEALVDLADAYFNAKGVKKDLKQAFALSLKAAEAQFPLGMLNAAKCYANGWGTKKDLTQALAWSKKAADAGLEEAKKLRNTLRKKK